MTIIDHFLERLFPATPVPIAKLRSHIDALVTVRGRVVPRDTIASPLSGERCVYYRYLVEEWRATTVPMALGPASGGLWLLVERDEAICEFDLEDDTGRALVLPEESRVEVERAPRVQPIEVPRGQRASEVRIAGGDLVEVIGMAGEVADLLDASRGYRDDAVRALVRAGPGEGSMLRIRVVG